MSADMLPPGKYTVTTPAVGPCRACSAAKSDDLLCNDCTRDFQRWAKRQRLAVKFQPWLGMMYPMFIPVLRPQWTDGATSAAFDRWLELGRPRPQNDDE